MPVPGRARAWLAATRPKTLTVGLVPVILGSAYAYRDGAFDGPVAAAALAGALLIQIGTNLANDYHDHVKGADRERVGPARASASGAIPARHVLAAALAAFGLSALVGLYLALVGGWPIVLIGLASIASGYAYTGGPYPLGYHGWGDAFVFVFFGLVAVAGTYYVQGGAPPPDVLIGGAAVGAVATGVLVVNNIRDRTIDERVGKRTLAVRLGDRGARAEYALLMLSSVAAPVMMYAWGGHAGQLLPLAASPLAALLVVRVVREREPRRLNPILGATAAYMLLYGLLFSAGVVWP